MTRTQQEYADTFDTLLCIAILAVVLFSALCAAWQRGDLLLGMWSLLSVGGCAWLLYISVVYGGEKRNG